jgi:hypothetical protein
MSEAQYQDEMLRMGFEIWPIVRTSGEPSGAIWSLPFSDGGRILVSDYTESAVPMIGEATDVEVIITLMDEYDHPIRREHCCGMAQAQAIIRNMI